MRKVNRLIVLIVVTKSKYNHANLCKTNKNSQFLQLNIPNTHLTCVAMNEECVYPKHECIVLVSE